MLPKPEKTKKINKNLLGDAEITQESEEVVAAKRLKTKRRLVLLSLCLTVGLSFVFWSFRHIKNFLNSPKDFSFHPAFSFQLPKINLNKTSSPKNTSSDSEIQDFLKNKNWSVISIFINKPNQPSFISNFDQSSFQFNPDQFTSIKKTDQSLINLNLPQGLLFQEKLTSSNGISYQNLISLPSSQLLINIIIPNISDIESVKPNLSQLVDQLYWYSVSRLSSE
ncbi:MAG: hypothetical protein KIH89_001935 [Candidatus Shapirobacteria bacterium]|nr:hypothetical protein [Candidatus Shapirobacteria bacterium]